MGMNIFYHISEKAIQDLENSWLCTFETYSDVQADKYYNLIIEKIEFIAQNFEVGRSVEYIKSGYRSITIKSHLIFYKQADDGIIEIIRILHKKMDIENRLKNNF
jgi:toxin ParE1/3/4